ncbi:hypothetical protein [Nocardia panacis]|nr:hypothetical protein [Nocardia panacis]
MRYILTVRDRAAQRRPPTHDRLVLRYGDMPRGSSSTAPGATLTLVR